MSSSGLQALGRIGSASGGEVQWGRALMVPVLGRWGVVDLTGHQACLPQTILGDNGFGSTPSTFPNLPHQNLVEFMARHVSHGCNLDSPSLVARTSSMPPPPTMP